MGQRAKAKALRTKARAELDKHMTGAEVKLADGSLVSYDPARANHAQREQARKVYLREER